MTLTLICMWYLNTYSKAPLWIWQTHGIGNTNPTPSLSSLGSCETLLDCTTPLQMSPRSLLMSTGSPGSYYQSVSVGTSYQCSRYSVNPLMMAKL